MFVPFGYRGFGFVPLTGCQTQSAQSAAIKTEATIVISVDTLMKQWAGFVTAGHATQKQVDQVKQLYQTYYNAQLVAKASLTAWVAGTGSEADYATAKTALGTAQVALVDFITELLKTIS